MFGRTVGLFARRDTAGETIARRGIVALRGRQAAGTTHFRTVAVGKPLTIGAETAPNAQTFSKRIGAHEDMQS